jgi:TonB family protein
VKQLGFFILFSVIFHFLVTTSTLYIAEKFYSAPNKPDVTQIEIVDSKEQALQEKIDHTRQMIKQLQKTVKEIKDPNMKARFESEKNQRVEKETKARNLGLTQNSAPQASSAAQKAEARSATEKVEKQEEGDLPEFARTRPHAASSAQVAASQNSAISNMLPNDVQDSNATNLNTDANIYYSFYNRVEELFYVRWVERVTYYWDRTSLDYRKNVLAGKVWSTQIEVWLKASGEFHSAYIRQSSGNKAFDEATVFAFKDAKFFPNPPKAKVEPDGFVRLRYRFNVQVAAY